MPKLRLSSIASTDLWSFICKAYEHEPVERLSLAWQDDYGADVCVLLTVAWLALRGAQLKPSQIAALDEVAQDWRQQVTSVLRDVRQRAKQEDKNNETVAQTYKLLQEAELESEAYTVECLQAFCQRVFSLDSEPGSERALREALSHYFTLLLASSGLLANSGSAVSQTQLPFSLRENIALLCTYY